MDCIKNHPGLFCYVYLCREGCCSISRAMARLFGCLFSALLLFSWAECCAAAKTESVLVDEYSMQLTVRALLGEEMRTHDKKISDLEKQMEIQLMIAILPQGHVS